MKLAAPLEIGICVHDLEGMVGFYRDVLGCEEVAVNAVAPDKSQAAGFTPAGYTIVRLQLNTGERIKLLKPNDEPQPSQSATYVLDLDGPAFLTFIVDDLDAMIARLAQAGVNLRTGSEKMEIRDGVWLCFAEDPEGNFLEFVEYADVGAYRPDRA